MEQNIRESLTPTEIRVLEIAWVRRATNDQIATQLGISTETVKSHLRNVRAKTGLSKIQAAQAVFERRPPPSGGNSDWGTYSFTPADDEVGAVQEDRVTFVHEALVDDKRRRPSALYVLALIVGIAAAIAIVLLAMRPLAESAAELADRIDPPCSAGAPAKEDPCQSRNSAKSSRPATR